MTVFFSVFQYYEYYGPDFNLHIQPSNMENLNTPNYLHKQEVLLMQALKELPHAPSVQYSYQPPRNDRFEAEEEDKRAAREHESQRDVRLSTGDVDRSVADRREFYADDQDQDGTTMPAQFVPQLVSNRTNAPSLLVAPPAAPSPATAAAAPAAAAPAAAPISAAAAFLQNPTMGTGQAAPAFHPSTATTAAGGPSISAPLANASAPMDTA